jgi:hypothetical protein
MNWQKLYAEMRPLVAGFSVLALYQAFAPTLTVGLVLWARFTNAVTTKYSH